MIGNSVIMELIADCVKWYYESYDYRAAKDEMDRVHPPDPNSCGVWDYMPPELMEKYAHMKTGKLRSLKFDPDGMISRMYVGRNHRYAKAFFPQDVGVKIKPILNKNDDKFGLIKAGLGVDESSLIM